MHHVGEQDRDLLVLGRCRGSGNRRTALVTELRVRRQLGAARPAHQGCRRHLTRPAHCRSRHYRVTAGQPACAISPLRSGQRVRRYAAPRGRGLGPDSADVRGRSASGVRFCGGVRSCGGCSFGGGDVSVHRCGGFDPSVGGRRASDAGGAGRHDKVLRTAIEAYDGFLFKHTGDGVVAAFASPMSAVNAAVDRATGVAVAGANGIGNRRGRAARRGLLRNGAQSSRTSDGRWAWRSDPVGRVDGGSAQRSGSAGSGAATVAGCADAGRGVPGPSGGPAHGVSAVAGAGCESGEPAACGHQLHRARVRGRRAASRGEGSSVGDVDRGGRGRQDPSGAGSRGAAGR